MSNLEYLIEQAAILVINGKATEDNALLMAIEHDNERLLTCIEAHNDRQRGYVNQLNKWQKGTDLVMYGAYEKMNKR